MKQLFNLVELTIEAITEPDRWTDLTNALCDRYGIPSATIFKSPLPDQPTTEFYFSDLLKTSQANKVVQHFAAGGDETDRLVYERFLTAPALQLVTEESFFGVERDTDMPFSTERQLMLDHVGVKSRLSSPLNESGPWRDVLALHSHQRSVDVPKQVFTEMNLLLPVVGRAMTTHRAFETLKRSFGSALSALDFLGFGAALLDSAGKVLYGNSYFNELINERDGMRRLPDNSIEFHSATTAAEFRKMVTFACEPHHHDGNRSQLRLSVPRKSLAEPYFLKLHSVRDRDGETDIHTEFTLMFVIDPTRAGSLSDAGILELGLLSKAETKVCEMLLTGASTDQIADMRDVSLNTARHQIKAVLSKLRCRDRLHLYQVAFTTHLPVRETSPRIDTPGKRNPSG